MLLKISVVATSTCRNRLRENNFTEGRIPALPATVL